MVYVHSNLRLIYRQREKWTKGRTKMWDVFPVDMGLDNTVELALANMDLNDPVLEPVTFDDGDPLEGSFSTPIDVDTRLGMEDEDNDNDDGGESSGSGADFVDFDMEGY